jgi:hypothetical protein
MKPVLAMAVALCLPALAGAEPTPAVRYDGFGPVRVGMTKAAASKALRAKLERTTAAGDNECEYLRATSQWKGVEFMFSRGRVARIDVVEGTTPTDSGVRIGDSISAIKTAYRARITETPHQYIPEPDGKYVTVKSPNGKYAIRFETDNGKIVTYYSGRFPEVIFVEHCL